MGCRLKKSIYGLKQASRQWYLKFDQTIRNFGFKENVEDNCVYAKFKNGKFIFLFLYVDDILLASSDVSLLLETKKFLSSKFDMKDLGEASFVLGIEIHRDRSKGVLGLSQKAYIERIFTRNWRKGFVIIYPFPLREAFCHESCFEPFYIPFGVMFYLVDSFTAYCFGSFRNFL